MQPTLIQERTNQELQTLINEVCQAMDDSTHNVQSWAEHITNLLDCLEFHAMANDPNHPEQFERMLARLEEQIAARLRHRSR